MRAPRSRSRAAGAASAAGGGAKLPTVGVSSAVRRAFNAALHPRDGSGRFRETNNPTQQRAPRRRGSAGGQEAPKRLTAGAQALKTSGVTGNDTIEVLSSRVRKYKGFTTVEAFVSGHPKGRAYALRILAADQKAGRIGFKGAAPAGTLTAPTKATILTKDATNPEDIPPVGTPGREFHDDMLRAASAFGPRSRIDVVYLADGTPKRMQVDVLNEAENEEIGVITRNFSTDREGNRVVEHEVFMLDKTLQGAGQAKQFLASSVDAYRHIGVDKIKLHANIDVGGYAWLRYGFRPDRAGVESLTKHVTDRIELLRKDGHIDDAMYGHLKRSVGFEDFQAVIDVGGSNKVTFDGKSQSLGKHIFLNSDWTGELDLNSRTAMNQFNSYIGGKQ